MMDKRNTRDFEGQDFLPGYLACKFHLGKLRNQATDFSAIWCSTCTCLTSYRFYFVHSNNYYLSCEFRVFQGV